MEYEEEETEYTMDHDWTLGGGNSSFMFNPSSSRSLPLDLPQPPVAYDDFEYPTSIPSFEWDLFPTTSTFTNPFSPTIQTPPYLIEQLNSQIINTSNQIPLSVSTSLLQSTPLLPLPPSSVQPTSLFDPSESSLFTSFLNTIEVDQNFLFNPILPPGMPSPPSTIYPMREEERRERERLGEGVGGIDLGFGRRSFINEELHWNVKQEDEEFEDDDENVEEEGNEWSRTRENGNRRTRNERVELSRDGNNNGKKMKVNESGQDWNSSREEAIDMEEMDSTTVEPSSSRTSGRINAGRRRNSRTSTSNTTTTPVTNSRTRRPSTNTRQTQIPLASSSNSKPPNRTNSRKESSPSPPDLTRSASPSQSPEDFNDNTNNDNNGIGSSSRKQPLSESQKRSNHILSEQRRRNAIRSGYKDLFDLVTNGETVSGIVVVPTPESEDGNVNGKKKKTKGSGRGRGRKGEVGAGASKSVVLEKASDYIRWLERGNQALEEEVDRVSSYL